MWNYFRVCVCVSVGLYVSLFIVKLQIVYKLWWFVIFFMFTFFSLKQKW